MKLKSFDEFISEKKKESFKDKIKGDGYFKGLSTSTARKKAAQMKKQAEMSDDDPDAYKPMPGSTKGKKLLKRSKFTKSYHELYGDKANEALITSDDKEYLNQITSFLKKYKDERGLNNDKKFTAEVIKVLKQRVSDRDGLVKKRFQKILKSIEKDFKSGNYLKLNESTILEKSKVLKLKEWGIDNHVELKQLMDYLRDEDIDWNQRGQSLKFNSVEDADKAKEWLGESALNEKFIHSKKDVITTANGIAKAISKMDNVKAEVHDLEYDKGKGAGFEISINGEKSAGGSYIVKDDGWVINVAIANKFPNAQYARIGDIKHRNPIGKVDIDDIIRNIKLYESLVNENSMITATGVSKSEIKYLKTISPYVKVQGPGVYITINDDNKKEVLDYLTKIKAEVSESIINEDEKEKQSTDRSPIDDDAIEAGLKNKSDETGVPIGILRAVMRRGMAAWRTGHRPGATQQQWGYARTNSFLVKSPGTWGRPIKDPKPKTGDAAGADADLAQEVIKGGYDKNLKKG